MNAPAFADAQLTERGHLIQDLRAEAHTAPEPARTLMRRAADDLASFHDLIVLGGERVLVADVHPHSIPIHPPEGEE